MRPSSPAQFEAVVTKRVPPTEEVRDGLWSLPLALPEWAGPLEWTLCYIYLEDSAATLVDPGWDLPINEERLASFLKQHGRNLNDASIVVTHLHEDHAGLARRLGIQGAPVAIHTADWADVADPEPALLVELLERWGVPEAERASIVWPEPPTYTWSHPSRLLNDRDVVDVGRSQLEVVHTPGHTNGSICLVDERNGLVLTGDHVLPTTNSGLGLGLRRQKDPIGDYLASLDRLSPYDRFEAAPGHEYRFRGLGERRDQLTAHHRKRSAEVAAILKHLDSSTVWQVAQQVHWTGGWSSLIGFLRRSALAQTEMHIDHINRFTRSPYE